MPLKAPYIIALLLCSMIASAQQGGVNSPFSLYGIGNLSDRGYMHLRQMGGMSTAYHDAYRLNFENPASLGFLLTTAFDVGIEAQNSSLKDNTEKSSLWSGNLGYVGIGFTMRNPVNDIFENNQKNTSWGMGLSLSPVSTISYNIAQRDSLDEVGRLERRYNGEGGFYKVAWSNGFRYKNLAAGLNMGYVFGKENYTRIVDFIDQTSAFDNNFTSTYTARGFTWDVGLMYNINLNGTKDDNTTLNRQNRKYLTVGITAKANTNLSTRAEELNINFFAPTAQDLLIDTVSYNPSTVGKGILPSEFSVGLTYSNENKLLIGADLRSTQWADYRNDAKPDQLTNTTRLSLGGYYCPNYKSVNSFWQRVQYRFGLYLDQDARRIKGKSINSYGVTLGLGMPFAWQRKFSNLNVGLDIRRRAVDNVLSETIYKLNFGFTFNDNEWFIKRKYN